MASFSSPLEAAKLGQRLHTEGDFPGAIAAYRRALRGGFQSPGLYYNFGALLVRLGRARSGVNVLAGGLSQYPENLRLLGEYLVSLSGSPYFPDATKAEEHFARVRDANLASNRRPAFPAHRRRRIGCISGEFREHPNAFLQFRHFRHFDRDRFQLYFYSTRDASDAYTAEAQLTADHWRDATGLSPQQIADTVRQDEIDILLDVSGHFAYSPLPVFALRPAPLQVSLSGYPATTGLPQVDFKVVDRITDPVRPTTIFIARSCTVSTGRSHVTRLHPPRRRWGLHRWSVTAS